MGEKVTLYSEVNYQGSAFELSEGKQNLTDGQQTFRSVKVPKDLTCYFFRTEGCEGVGMPLHESSSNLGKFSGTFRSVSVISQPEKTIAIVFSEENFGGAAQVLHEGKYKLADLTIGDNRIRSLNVVSRSHQVILYDSPSFSGRAVSYMSQARALGDFADRTSSIEVKRVEGECVLLYENKNYCGRTQALGAGDYDSESLLIGNNAASSIFIPPGLTVTLFDRPNFLGEKLVLEKSVRDLGAFNDRMSSLIIEKKQEVGALSKVRVYTDTLYRGMCQSLPVGNYNVEDIGFLDNAIASLKIPSGFGVNLYVDRNLEGEDCLYMESSDNVGALSGRVSSIKVFDLEPENLPIVTYGQSENTKQLDVGANEFYLAAGATFVVNNMAGFDVVAALLSGSTLMCSNNEYISLEHEPIISFIVSPLEVVSSAMQSLGEDAKQQEEHLVAPEAPEVERAYSLSAEGRANWSKRTWNFTMFGVVFASTYKWDGRVDAHLENGLLHIEGNMQLAPPLSVTTNFVYKQKSPGVESSFTLKTPLRKFLVDHVRSKAPASVWKTVESVAMPFLECFTHFDVNSITDDTGTRTTMRAEVPMHRAEPLKSLHQLFPFLGLDGLYTIMELTHHNVEGAFDLTFEQSLNEEVAFCSAGGTVGTPNCSLVFRQLRFSIDNATVDVFDALEIEFELVCGEDVLRFIGRVEQDSDLGTVVLGTYRDNDGDWQQPFNTQGLNISGLRAQLSAIPEHPYVAIHLQGGVLLGEQPFDADLELVFEPNSGKCRLDIKHKHNTDIHILNPLVEQDIRSGLPKLPLSDLTLELTPGETLQASASVNLWGQQVTLSGPIGYRGAALTAAYTPQVLSLGSTTIVELQNNADNWMFAAILQNPKSKRGLHALAAMAFFDGLYTAQAYSHYSADRIELSIPSDVGIYSGGRILYQDNTIRLQANPSFSATVSLRSASVELSVECELVTISAHQLLTFQTAIGTQEISLNPVKVTAPLTCNEDLAREFCKAFSDEFDSSWLDTLLAVDLAAIEWVSQRVSTEAKDVTKFFVELGAETASLVAGVSDYFRTSQEAIEAQVELVSPGINQLMIRYDGALAGQRMHSPIAQVPDTACVCTGQDDSYLITHQRDGGYRTWRAWARPEMKQPWAIGNLGCFFRSMHALPWSSATVLAQKNNGEWVIYVVESGKLRSVASGRFEKYYQVVVPYTRQNQNYLFLHARDGGWKTVKFAGYRMENQASSSLSGSYTLACHFLDHGVPHVFLHQNGQGFQILELCADGATNQTSSDSWNITMQAATVVHRDDQNWLQVCLENKGWISREIFATGLNNSETKQTKNTYTKLVSASWEGLEYLIGFSDRCLAEDTAKALDRPPPKVTAWASWSCADNGLPVIDAASLSTGVFLEQPLAVTGNSAGAGLLCGHYRDKSWVRYEVNEAGELTPRFEGGEFDNCYPLFVVTEDSSRFFGQTKDGMCAYWIGLKEPWSTWRPKVPYQLMLDSGESQVIAITSEGVCEHIVGSVDEIKTTHFCKIDSDWMHVIGLNYTTDDDAYFLLVSQNESGQLRLWDKDTVVATQDLGKYHSMQVYFKRPHSTCCDRFIVADDGGNWQVWEVRKTANTWKFERVSSGTLDRAPSKLLVVRPGGGRGQFLLGTWEQVSDRAPGYAWMLQALTDEGLPGHVAASGVMQTWPENAHVLNLNGQPCVFGQDGSKAKLVSTSLPLAGSLARQNAASTLLQHYDVLVPYTVSTSCYVIGHARDGTWHSYRRVDATLQDGRSLSGAPSGYYQLVATYRISGRVFCFMQKESGDWSIRELKRTGSMGGTISSGNMKEVYGAFIPFTSDGKQYAIAWVKEVGSWSTFELSATGSAPKLVASHKGLHGVQDVGALPPVDGNPRFLAYVNGDSHTADYWYILELVDGGQRLRRVASGIRQTKWTRISTVEANGQTWIVGLLAQDMSTKPLAISTVHSKSLVWAESTPVDESGLSTSDARPSYSYGTIVAAAKETQRADLIAEMEQRNTRRRGLVMGKGKNVRLPGMSISFHRGLVIQVRVKPLKLTGEMTLFELGSDEGVPDRIALTLDSTGKVGLGWHAEKDNAWQQWHSDNCLMRDRWYLVTVAISKQGASLFYDGSRIYFTSERVRYLDVPGDDASEIERIEYQEERKKMDPMPVECPRTTGLIGDSSEPESLCIGEVRLWNRTDTNAILARSHRKLRGDEIGLMGWWIFEDRQTKRFVDGSPFARDGMSESYLSEGPLPAYAFAEYPLATSHRAAKFGGSSEIVIEDINIPGPDFTWQAYVSEDNIPGEATLFELTSYTQDSGWESGPSYLTNRRLTISLLRGRVIRVDGEISLDIGNVCYKVEFTCSWPPLPSLGYLTVRRDVDGRYCLFRQGKLWGEPLPCQMTKSYGSGWRGSVGQGLSYYLEKSSAMVARLLDENISYKLMIGHNFYGRMQEVRFWSRALSQAEIEETNGRRIHNWAPRLTAYFRLDDLHPTTSVLNGALGAEEAELISLGEPVQQLFTKEPPALDIPRVVWLSQNRIDLGRSGRCQGRALSIQFWVRLDAVFVRSTDAEIVQEVFCGEEIAEQLEHELDRRWGTTAKKLVQLQDDDTTWFDIETDKNGRVSLTYIDDENVSQDMVIPSLLTPGVWTHVTVVLERGGATAVYRNGELIGREMNGIPPVRKDSSRILLGEVPAAMAELRLWRSELRVADIRRDMHRRLQDTGLLSCFGLDEVKSHFSSTHDICFVEAPGLKLSLNPRPARAMVRTTCDVIPDHSEAGENPPALIVDAQALDRDGQPIPNAELKVLFESEAVAYRDYIAEANQLFVTTGKAFTLQTDATGNFRLALALEDLTAPIIRLRHAQMGESEWNIVSPSDVLIQEIYSLTADELTNGHSDSATTKKRAGIAETNEDGKRLEDMLRLLAAPAMAARFEAETTAVLAFSDESDDEVPAPPVFEQVAPGVYAVKCAESDAIVQRLSVPQTGIVKQQPQSEDMAVSFGVFEFAESIFGAFTEAIEWVTEGVTKVGTVVREGISATFRVVNGVLQSVKYMIDTVVNGIKVVVEYVVEKAIEAVRAIWNFVKAIGLKIFEFVKFLFGLFDFGDFLEASTYMMSLIDQGINIAKYRGVKTLEWLGNNVDEMGSVVRKAIGASNNSSVGSAVAGGMQRFSDGASTALKPLMWLLSLVQKPLSKLFDGLLVHFEPLFRALDNVLSTLGDALLDSTKKALSIILETVASIDSLQAVSLDILRNLVGGVVDIFVDILKAGVDVGKEVVGVLFDSLRSVLDVRIEIPIVTKLLEWILGVRLTFSRVFTLIGAIPTVLTYKIARGTTSSPFSGTPELGAALSYSDDDSDESDDSNPAGDLALRGIGLAWALVTNPLDLLGTLKDAETPKGIDVACFVFDILHDGVLGCPHLNAVITNTDLSEVSERSWFLAYCSWGCTLLGLVTGGIALCKDDDEFDFGSQVCGLFAGGLGIINTIWDTAIAEDKEVGVADCVKDIASWGSALFQLSLKPGKLKFTLVGVANTTVIVSSAVGLGIAAKDA